MKQKPQSGEVTLYW